MKKVLILLSSITILNAYDISKPQVQHFISFMHKKYGFSKQYLQNTFLSAKFIPSALNRYNGKIKNATDYSWARYKAKIFIPQSIALGKHFMQKYKNSLKKAQQRFGINKEIITAFIRVESKFGLFGGEYRAIDVLSTLAFNPNRKQHFFKNELKNLFLLSKRANLNIFQIKSSFAGAIGCVQQMPSIYLRYSVDLDGNGKKDPNNLNDCIGSIAKFLSLNGWKNNGQTLIKPQIINQNYRYLSSKVRSYYNYLTLKRFGIIAPKQRAYYFIKLFDGKRYDIYLGDENYRVITKYNYSKQYATAIALYAKELQK